jgi:hypothetical protein
MRRHIEARQIAKLDQVDKDQDDKDQDDKDQDRVEVTNMSCE